MEIIEGKQRINEFFDNLAFKMVTANYDYDKIWPYILESVNQFNSIVDNLGLNSEHFCSQGWKIGKSKEKLFTSQSEKAKFAIYHFLSGIDSRIPLCCAKYFCLHWIGIGDFSRNLEGAYFTCPECAKKPKTHKILANDKDESWWYKAINCGRDKVGKWKEFDFLSEKTCFYTLEDNDFI